MNVPFFIARRYFFSKKSRFVNLISKISIISIMVATAALIIVLSVFNGLDSLVKSMFNTFDPDFAIEAKLGRTFDEKRIDIQKISQLKGIDKVVFTLEDNALIRQNGRQEIVMIKGVGSDFENMTALSETVIGNFKLGKLNNVEHAVVGAGIFQNLEMRFYNYYEPFSIHVPKKGKYISANPEASFYTDYVVASGAFSAIAEYDYKYVLVDLAFAQELFEEDGRASKLEVSLNTAANAKKVQQEIEEILGTDFIVKNRYQQQEMTYKTFQSERLIIILILSFILLISTFNMIASLMMLVYDKKKDIKIFGSMGGNLSFIRKIFLFEGLMISSVGGLLGLLLGGLISWTQQTFGIIKLGSDSANFVVSAYPVEIQAGDFVMVLGMVVLIGLFSSVFPILKIRSNKY